MAIQANEVLYDKYNRPKTTKLTYWAYRPMNLTLMGEAGFVENIQCYNGPKDASGKLIPQRAVKVVLDGYVSEEARLEAKKNGTAPDHVHEFLIVNWIEEKVSMRDLTLDEMRNLYLNAKGAEALAKITDKQLQALSWPQVEDEATRQFIPHNDFDEFIKVINTPEEAATAYKLLKSNPAHANFFDGTKDI